MARKSRKHLQKGEVAVGQSVQPAYKAAAYARLSVEDNYIEDGCSIETQRDMLTSFIAGQPDMSLYDAYTDNGCTGANFDRNDFTRMMDDIRDGLVNCVVVKDLSRFGRNYIEAGNYIEKIFPFLGVRFIAINDGYDSSKNDVSDIMVTMKNIVNQAYLSDISSKIRTMFETKQNSGDYIGWSAPYGFLKVEGNNNRLVLDPEYAPIVRQIFEWKADDQSAAAIARRLNEIGIPSPRTRNIQMGKYKNNPTDGQFWTTASIFTIIKNPVYAGHMTQHKYSRNGVNGRQVVLDKSKWVIVKNTHEAIVSDALWEQAQTATAQNYNNFKPSKRRKSTYNSIFKSLLFCPTCEKRLAQKISRVKDNKYVHFACASRKVNPNCCTPFIREDALTVTVFECIKEKMYHAAKLHDTLERLSKNKEHIERINKTKQAMGSVDMRLRRIAALKSGLFERFSDELITEQEFRRMKDEYTLEAERLSSKKADLEQELDRLSKLYSADNPHVNVFLQFRRKKKLSKEMIAALVEKIVVYNAQHIEIVWKSEDEYRAICAVVNGGEA